MEALNPLDLLATVAHSSQGACPSTPPRTRSPSPHATPDAMISKRRKRSFATVSVRTKTMVYIPLPEDVDLTQPTTVDGVTIARVVFTCRTGPFRRKSVCKGCSKGTSQPTPRPGTALAGAITGNNCDSPLSMFFSDSKEEGAQLHLFGLPPRTAADRLLAFCPLVDD